MPVARLSPSTANKIEQAGDYAEKLYREGHTALDSLVKAADKYGLQGEQAHLLVRGWNTSQVRELMTSTKEASQRLRDLDLVSILDFDAARHASSRKSSKKASCDEVWVGYYQEPSWQIDKPQPPLELPEDPSLLERRIKQAEQLITRRYAEYESTVKLAGEELARLREELAVKLDHARRDVVASRLDLRTVAENLKVAHPSAYKVFCTIQDTIPAPAEPNDYCLYDSRKIPYSSLIACGELAEKVARYELAYRELCRQYETIKKAAGKDQVADHGVELLDPALHNPGGFYTSRDFHQPPQPLISASELDELFNKRAQQDPQQDPQQSQLPPYLQPQPQAQPQNQDPNQPLLQPQPYAYDLSAYAAQPQDRGDSQERSDHSRDAQRVLSELSAQLSRLFSNMGQSSLSFPSPPNIAEKIEEKVFGGHTQAVTRAMRMPALVIKLMATDEILSQYPPNKVQEAFTYLHEIAPLMMENPAVAREFLRKYLAQGETLDSYDMKLLVDMEARRRKSVLSEPLD